MFLIRYVSNSDRHFKYETFTRSLGNTRGFLAKMNKEVKVSETPDLRIRMNENHLVGIYRASQDYLDHFTK